MQTLASIITKPWVIASLIGILVMWAGGSAAKLYLGTRRLSRELTDARRQIEAAGDILGFAANFEQLSAELENKPFLGPRWREYREALLVPAQVNRPVRSTAQASLWFDSAQLLRAAGVDSRYHAALPNLLVGTGLLFTFLGLAAALSTASGIVEAGASQEQRNAALEQLLATASFKFITSLVGLGLSIAYALLRKNRLKRIDIELDRFLAALEKRLPLITPAQLQEEANRLLEKQNDRLETFSTELAVNIGTAFDKAFDQRLGEHIGPLTEAMQKLAGNVSERSESAIETMLTAFLERLQGGTGDRMQQVAENLGALGARLEGLQAGLGEAAVRMAQSADAMAARMGEGAEQALSRITDQMGGLAEVLRSIAEQTKGAAADAGANLSARIESAAEEFQRSAREVADTMAQAMDAMRRRMGDEAEAATARLSKQLEAMVGELRSLAEASRSAGAEAFEALANRIAAAASGFEATAANVARVMEQAGEASGGALGRGAEDAVRRIAEATEGMRAELRAMLEELRQSVSAAGETVRTSAAAGGEVLRGSLAEAGATLARAAEQVEASGIAAGRAVREGGEAAAGRFEQASIALAGRIEGLGAEARRLGETVHRVADKVAELERAAQAAASPLVATASDLKSAGASVAEALQPLRTVAQGLRDLTEQVAGAVSRLEATQTAGARLMEAMTQAAARFEGVDRDLARTLDRLQTGLRGFTQEVGDFVEKTDTNLAKAATHLSSSVKALEDTLADFLSEMRTPR